jgi:hypothetical protein
LCQTEGHAFRDFERFSLSFVFVGAMGKQRKQMTYLFKKAVKVYMYDVARVGVEENVFAVSVAQSERGP